MSPKKIVLVLIVAIAGASVAWLTGAIPQSITAPISSAVTRYLPAGFSRGFADPQGYVAVYLKNGKVYFGKLRNSASPEPALTDVFFLNITSIKEEEPEKEPDSNNAPATVERANIQTDYELVKMTDQLQGSEDRLVLSRDSILFFEPLRDDSRVVEAIAKYESQTAQ